MPIEFLTNKSTIQNARTEFLEGREYTVVPLVMMTECVANGSDGPAYYPAEEHAKAAPSWNHKPIVVYHPTTGSACDPTVLNNRKVGLVLNTRWDSKLRSEAWIENQRALTVDKRIMDFIHNSTVMEVSTGLFVDKDKTSGKFGDTEYNFIARNHRPDHLALLPDQIGACSVAMGAGLLANEVSLELLLNHATSLGKGVIFNTLLDRLSKNGKLQEILKNEISHSNLYSALYREMRKELNDNGWIEDVYDTFFIYSLNSKLYRRSYTSTDTEVNVTGEPEEVVRVTEYRKTDGSFVGNTNSGEPLVNEEDNMKTKKELVDGLIANKATKFEEKNREELMKLSEETLALLEPVENTKVVVTDPAAVAEAAKQGAQGIQPTANTATQPAKPVSVEEYIGNAPAEIQEFLAESIHNSAQAKEQLVTTIMNAKGNIFTKDQLMGKKMAELRGIAALAQVATQNAQSAAPTMNYFGGQAAPIVNAGEGGTQKPLPRPVMTFGDQK